MPESADKEPIFEVYSIEYFWKSIIYGKAKIIVPKILKYIVADEDAYKNDLFLSKE